MMMMMITDTALTSKMLCILSSTQWTMPTRNTATQKCLTDDYCQYSSYATGWKNEFQFLAAQDICLPQHPQLWQRVSFLGVEVAQA
jgi:hypothetical protein